MNEDMKQRLLRAKQGDEEAFNFLYQEFYTTAYYIAFQMTKNEEDAKDIVQETFLTIHTSIKNLRDVESFPAWMKMIIHSKCIKLFRKKYAAPVDPIIINASQQQEYRKDMDPHESYSYQSEQEVLHQLIQNLKPRYREVIELVYLKQMKVDEAAAYLHISSGTVKTRMHRARKDLLAEIKQFEIENHRKLDFHGDTLLAVSSFGVFTTFAKQQVTNLKHLVSTNVMTSACAATLGVLAVTGGVFAYEDISKGSAHSLLSFLSQQPKTEQKEKETPILQKQAFHSTNYQETNITNSRTAYFTCINFAMDEETMKSRSAEEYQELEPVYQALKQRNDEYYQKLVREGWTQLYESIRTDSIE